MIVVLASVTMIPCEYWRCGRAHVWTSAILAVTSQGKAAGATNAARARGLLCGCLLRPICAVILQTSYACCVSAVGMRHARLAVASSRGCCFGLLHVTHCALCSLIVRRFWLSCAVPGERAIQVRGVPQHSAFRHGVRPHHVVRAMLCVRGGCGRRERPVVVDDGV